jgi:hypothetical protein
LTDAKVELAIFPLLVLKLGLMALAGNVIAKRLVASSSVARKHVLALKNVTPHQVYA